MRGSFALSGGTTIPSRGGVVGWMSGFLRRSRVGVTGAMIGYRLSGKDPNRDSGSGRGPGFGRGRAGRVASLRVETRYRSHPPEQNSRVVGAGRGGVSGRRAALCRGVIGWKHGILHKALLSGLG